MDWNFAAFKSLFGFFVVLGLAVWAAIATHTGMYALAGGASALVLQFVLYLWGTSRGVGQGFDITLPLHRMTRWGNTWFRTVKTCAELIFLAGVVAFALLRMNSIVGMASLIGFAVLFTSVPLPVVLWAYYAKVLRPSRQAMAPPKAPTRVVASRPARPSSARIVPPTALPRKGALPLAGPNSGLPRLPQSLHNSVDPDDSTL